MIIFSFLFLQVTTTNFVFMVTAADIQSIVRKSAVFIILPALVMPLNLVFSRQIKKAIIIFFVNMLVATCGMLIARGNFENAVNYAFYTAFSAIACLAFVLEYIVPKMRKLDIPRGCLILQIILGMIFMVLNILFDFIGVLNPQNYSNPRLISLIPLFAVALVLPVYFCMKRDFEKMTKAFLIPLPAILLYAVLMLLHDNGNLPIWNYRLIYAGGLVCIFAITGYYFYSLRSKAKLSLKNEKILN